MAKIDVTNQSAPSTPSSGTTSIYVDTADKKLKTKDDTGTVTDYSAAGNSITSLTGEVTASGPGAAAATVTNSAVLGKVLTGYVAGSGIVSATDTILQAFQKLGGKLDTGWYGDGSDGSVTISSDTTLVRDMYYVDLTIQTGANLNTGGFRIHGTGTCTVQSGASINRNGNNASGATAGATVAAGTVGGGTAGGAGGGAAAGTAGTNQTAQTSVGSAGGAGGTGSAGAGGAAGTASVPAATTGGAEVLKTIGRAAILRDVAGTLLTGGSGGGGGGGNGTASTGGGGASGAGNLSVSFKTITGSGTISAIGGTGGNAVGANAGGGGGGGGGAVVLISDNDTTATSLTVSVAGGSGGGGAGTGLSGAAGSAGRIYRIRA